MTYRGRVRNGVVVFEGAAPLDEGTPVRIEPLLPEPARMDRGTPESIRCCSARWAGDPAELDELLDEVHRLRDADLTPADDR